MTAALSLVVAAGPSRGEENKSFLVSPDAGAIAWTVAVVLFAIAALSCGALLVAKRRWGWVVVGLVTLGIGWFIAPIIEAVPGSPWALRTAARRNRDARGPRPSM